MPEKNAVILDNWFPGTDTVKVRKGNSSWATGMTGAVESLIEYIPLDGDGELFAANDGKIYDVSSTGAVGAAVVSGMTNDRWNHVNMGTSAGQYVLAFNGADTGRLYDGSTWSTVSITGPTAADVITANIHQRRLWLIEKDSLSAWYLAVNSISGTATEFPLAGIAKRGGYIMAMGTWSLDAGDGLDDVAIFVTSEGEAIVYQGTDPSSASTWGLVGVFQIGKPIGRRCMVKAGADLVIVTEDGFVPLSGILKMDRSQSRLVSLSDQIQSAVNAAVKIGGSIYGWQPILYPRGTMLIFNIPVSGTTSNQYVFNTITGAPCRFTGINAVCFGEMNDNIYWGGYDGTVYKFDDGTSDAGTAILADGLQAFSYFGSPALNKVFKLAEPIFTSNGNPNAAIDFETDFVISTPSGYPVAQAGTSALWGISKWGVGTWSSAAQVYRGWRGIRGSGRAGAVRVRITTSLNSPEWLATNYSFQTGGIL